jgi:hypothetical protein
VKPFAKGLLAQEERPARKMTLTINRTGNPLISAVEAAVTLNLAERQSLEKWTRTVEAEAAVFTRNRAFRSDPRDAHRRLNALFLGGRNG